jgi:hypothetical protein
MSMSERAPAAALRAGVRHIHEWYSQLTDDDRREVGGVIVTFDDDGLGMTVAVISATDKEPLEGAGDGQAARASAPVHPGPKDHGNSHAQRMDTQEG